MSNRTRNAIYLVLAILNTALFTAQQQGMVPGQYSQYALAASFVLAAAMKEFGAKDPQKPADPDPRAAAIGFDTGGNK